MSYVKKRSLNYALPRKRGMRLSSAYTGTRYGGYGKYKEAARMASLSSFMARFLSGKQNIRINFYDNGNFSAQHETTKHGDKIYRINLPRWETYDLPIKGFDKFRIYNCGLWHESSHVRYTPPALFSFEPTRPLYRYLFNIFEDRRIEDLGVEQWPGFLPERLYMQAYAYALRPSVEEIDDPDFRKIEALLQRFLIGRIKGNLPSDELEKVEKCNKLFEEKLKEMKEPTYPQIEEMIDEAVKILKIDPTKPQPPPWEDTFTEDYARLRGKYGKEAAEEVKKDMEEYFKDLEEKAKPLKKGEEKADPKEITDGDVEAARSGSPDVRNRYESAIKETKEPPELVHFLPVPSRGPASLYKDQQFITSMMIRLKDWKVGFKKIVGEKGASLSVREYLRSRGETPFETRIKRSVHGKKVLIIADFSGSMNPREGDYKSAVINAAEAIDSIGANVALFTFAKDPSYGEGFYKVKTFEERNWKPDHSARVAALLAEYYSTPLAAIYANLADYLKKHRPIVAITMTDGEPDLIDETRNQVKAWKKYTRMVAFGLPEQRGDAEKMEKLLSDLGYNSYVVVDNIRELPTKLVKAIAPES